MVVHSNYIYMIRMLLYVTHFCEQIERELVLSAEKASTKIPLMHEPRTPAGPSRRTAAGIPLLPRSTGAIAPDHPLKMQQAWVSVRSGDALSNSIHGILLIASRVVHTFRYKASARWAN